MIVVTGIYLEFPSYGRGLIGQFSPVASPWPEYVSRLPSNPDRPQTISLSELEQIADAHCPGGEFRYIVFPNDATGSYEVGKRAPDEPNRLQAQRRIWIDQYSGEVLALRDRSSQSSGDVFVEWLYPLHTGEAFGLTGQLIILLIGFVPLLLYVTGVIRWLQKRRVKRLEGG